MPDEKQIQQPAAPVQNQPQPAQPSTQSNPGVARSVEAEPAPIEHLQGATKNAGNNLPLKKGNGE